MYLKYLEDNLNHKFTKEIDEYKNYVKMFYNDRAKCPKDLKTALERTQDNRKIELWCKNWKVSIIKPIVVNLIILLETISNSYKKILTYLCLNYVRIWSHLHINQKMIMK